MSEIFETVDLEEAYIEGDILKNVMLLGAKSKNGYGYSPKARQQAVPLLEGMPVYEDHAADRKTGKVRMRNYMEKNGYLVNVHEDTDCVRGDWKFNPHHPHSAAIRWDVENKTPKAGFSIEGKGMLNKTTNVVEEMQSIGAICLVDNPATTKNFVESVQEDDAKMATLQEEVRLLTEKATQLEQTLIEANEKIETLSKKKIENKSPLSVNITEAAKEDPYSAWLKNLKEKR